MKTLFLLLSVVVFSLLFVGCETDFQKDFEQKTKLLWRLRLDSENPRVIRDRITLSSLETKITQVKASSGKIDDAIDSLRQTLDAYRCSHDVSYVGRSTFFDSYLGYISALGRRERLRQKLSGLNRQYSVIQDIGSLSFSDLAYIKEFPFDCETAPLIGDSSPKRVFQEELFSVSFNLDPVLDVLHLTFYPAPASQASFSGTIYVYADSLTKDGVLDSIGLYLNNGKGFLNTPESRTIHGVSSVKKIVLVYVLDIFIYWGFF